MVQKRNVSLFIFIYFEASIEIPKIGKYTGSKADGLTGHTKELETNKTMMKFSSPPALKQRAGIDVYLQLIENQENVEHEDYKKKDFSG